MLEKTAARIIPPWPLPPPPAAHLQLTICICLFDSQIPEQKKSTLGAVQRAMHVQRLAMPNRPREAVTPRGKPGEKPKPAWFAGALGNGRVTDTGRAPSKW